MIHLKKIDDFRTDILMRAARLVSATGLDLDMQIVQLKNSLTVFEHELHQVKTDGDVEMIQLSKHELMTVKTTFYKCMQIHSDYIRNGMNYGELVSANVEVPAAIVKICTKFEWNPNKIRLTSRNWKMNSSRTLVTFKLQTQSITCKLPRMVKPEKIYLLSDGIECEY